MNPSIATGLAVLLAVAGASFSCAPEAPEDAADPELAKLVGRFQQRLDQLREELGFPGAVASFVLEDGRLGTVATGYADLEQQIPMTIDTKLAAGSVGKTFVPMVALALQHEGKLSLDDKAEKWLGNEDWFDRLPNHAEMTLRHLLTHSSGMTDHVFDPEYAATMKRRRADPSYDPDSYLTPRESLEFALDKEPLFPAGEGYAYTDTGYLVAGMVLEAASAKTFYQEVQDRFIGPLDLTHTVAQTQRAIPGLAAGYAGQGGDYAPGLTETGLPSKVAENGVMAFNPAAEWTGGGFVSNPQDLVRWARAMYEGKALDFDYTTEQLASGYRGGDPHPERPSVYGLGVFIIDDPAQGTRRLGHGGFFPGYNTSNYYYPEYRFAVCVQVNTSVGNLRHPLEVGLGQVLLDHLRK